MHNQKLCEFYLSRNGYGRTMVTDDGDIVLAIKRYGNGIVLIVNVSPPNKRFIEDRLVHSAYAIIMFIDASHTNVCVLCITEYMALQSEVV